MAFLIKKQQALNANLSEQKTPDGFPASKRLNQSARRLTPISDTFISEGLKLPKSKRSAFLYAQSKINTNTRSTTFNKICPIVF